MADDLEAAIDRAIVAHNAMRITTPTVKGGFALVIEGAKGQEKFGPYKTKGEAATEGTRVYLRRIVKAVLA